MTTRRHPIERPLARRITPRCIALYLALCEARSGSKEWWALHNELHEALALPPWRYPVPPELCAALDKAAA